MDCILAPHTQPWQTIMVNRTHAPVRTVRQEAAEILTVDYKTVSTIFSEIEKGKGKESAQRYG